MSNGREVVDAIDIVQRAPCGRRITDRPGKLGHSLGQLARWDWIEDAHGLSGLHKCRHQMPAQKAASAGNQRAHVPSVAGPTGSLQLERAQIDHQVNP